MLATSPPTAVVRDLKAVIQESAMSLARFGRLHGGPLLRPECCCAREDLQLNSMQICHKILPSSLAFTFFPVIEESIGPDGVFAICNAAYHNPRGLRHSTADRQQLCLLRDSNI